MKTNLPPKARAIKAKCIECMGFNADGRLDCEITTCPLYSYMPYKKKKPNLWWLGVKISALGCTYDKAIAMLKNAKE